MSRGGATAMSRCLICQQEIKERISEPKSIIKGREPFDEIASEAHELCVKRFYYKSAAPTCRYSHSALLEIIKSHTNGQNSQTITANIVDNNGELHIEPHGDDNSRYTLTLPQTTTSQEVILEDLTMRMASLSRTNTARHAQIRTSDGVICLLTERPSIDRQMRPLTIQSLDELKSAGLYTETNAIEEVAKQLSSLTTSPKLELINIFERTLFCYLIGDFSHERGIFSIVTTNDGTTIVAPSTKFYPTSLMKESGETQQLPYTINGQDRDVTIEDFKTSMTSCGISDKVAENLITKFSNSIDSWCDLIDAAPISEELCEQYKFHLFIRSSAF